MRGPSLGHIFFACDIYVCAWAVGLQAAISSNMVLCADLWTNLIKKRDGGRLGHNGLTDYRVTWLLSWQSEGPGCKSQSSHILLQPMLTFFAIYGPITMCMYNCTLFAYTYSIYIIINQSLSDFPSLSILSQK